VGGGREVSPSAWALGLRHTLEEAPGGIGFDPLSRPDQKLSDEVPRKESEKWARQENSTHPSSRKKAVRLVHTSDESWQVPKIARDPGVSPETFRKKRVNQGEIDAGDRGGLPPKSEKNCAAFVEKRRF
jgi:hypothetical protein